MPNIVMFAADGVNADHTSAYGYSRKTTPHLDAYLGHALIAGNAFTNSGWTTGSLTSMMSGKYPTTTKVLYPPYTLTGKDAYQTLPHILKQLGYTNLQETVRYYADGPDLNWADSFDFANGRALGGLRFEPRLLSMQLPDLFAYRLYERLSTRLAHVSLIDRMMPRSGVETSDERGEVFGVTDAARMAQVAKFLQKPRQPFFIHIHLMGTHCCHYRPKHPQYSARPFQHKEQARAAARDDTIVESDDRFGELLRLLKRKSLLRNTLIVYSSDHSEGWDFRSRVPLIFLFPGGDHKGRIEATAQLLDVAPTVLDYLKVPVPGWMEGKSLLHGNLDIERPVFVSYRFGREKFIDNEDSLARITTMGPPTYGLKQVGMVVCQRWYAMDMDTSQVLSGPTDHEGKSCPKQSLPSDKEARQMMRGHLGKRGIRF